NRKTQEEWFDAGGQLVDTIHYNYDDAGRLTDAHDIFASRTLTYYDDNRLKTDDNAGTPGAPHVVLTYTPDEAGNVVSVAETIDGNPAATTSYVYDPVNRVTEITQ